MKNHKIKANLQEIKAHHLLRKNLLEKEIKIKINENIIAAKVKEEEIMIK
jgi:hypothetical protein